MNEGITDKSVLIIGLGRRTGLAAANFLAARGNRVAVSDVKRADELRELIEKLDPGVMVLAGVQEPRILDAGYDMLVISPGVPSDIPLVAEARRRGIPVIAEIELAYQFLKGRIIAITGTDGKSTTTCLTGHILAELGLPALVGGNIGIPLISLVDDTTEDSISVVELSSFQLETIDRFRPDAGAILNVSPDHLDRYTGMKEYLEAKMRIAISQTSEDYFIYNRDDERLASAPANVKSRVLSFSLSDSGADAFFKDGRIHLKETGCVLDPSRMKIIGIHNVQNAMASILLVASVLKKMGIIPEYQKIASACESFKGLAHRMEPLGEFKGRLFINDSKATTVGAVEMALRSLPGRGVLILGGRTKGDDYSRLAAPIRTRVRHLVLIGETTDEFSRIFADLPHSAASSLDEAVETAMGVSEEGDAVILSPACTSFDMFKDFEERGNAFRESFEKLKRGELSWI